MPQFLSYLAHPDVKSFKNLVYVFNDAKLNQGEDSPQNMMRQLYIKYAKEIFHAKPELFTTVKLFEPKKGQIYIKTHEDLEEMARFTESEKMDYFKEHFLSFIISK